MVSTTLQNLLSFIQFGIHNTPYCRKKWKKVSCGNKTIWFPADLTVPESVKLLCLQYVCNILVSNCWKTHKIARLAINAPHKILGQKLVRLGFTKSNSNQQAMTWFRTRAMLCWMPILCPAQAPHNSGWDRWTREICRQGQVFSIFWASNQPSLYVASQRWIRSAVC